MEQREHPKKFQGEFYQGIVVEVASTTALVYNELCVMEMAEVVMAVSAPLKPGMCIETPRNADYSSPLYAYRVLEHAYKLDKLGRVKMNALISFPKGFDDPTNVFSMCGWCPDVDRILVMPEFFFKLDGDTKGIKDGVLYQGDIVFALRSAVDPEMVPRQLKVETRWVCVKNSLKEIKDDGTIREFIEKTKKPEVAKRDQKMPIWIRGYEKVFRPEPKAMISSRPSSSQNPTQGVFVDDSRNTSPIGEGMENEQEVDSEPDLEGHYFITAVERQREMVRRRERKEERKRQREMERSREREEEEERLGGNQMELNIPIAPTFIQFIDREEMNEDFIVPSVRQEESTVSFLPSTVSSTPPAIPQKSTVPVRGIFNPRRGRNRNPIIQEKQGKVVEVYGSSAMVMVKAVPPLSPSPPRPSIYATSSTSPTHQRISPMLLRRTMHALPSLPSSILPPIVHQFPSVEGIPGRRFDQEKLFSHTLQTSIGQTILSVYPIPPFTIDPLRYWFPQSKVKVEPELLLNAARRRGFTAQVNSPKELFQKICMVKKRTIVNKGGDVTEDVIYHPCFTLQYGIPLEMIGFVGGLSLGQLYTVFNDGMEKIGELCTVLGLDKDHFYWTLFYLGKNEVTMDDILLAIRHFGRNRDINGGLEELEDYLQSSSHRLIVNGGDKKCLLHGTISRTHSMMMCSLRMPWKLRYSGSEQTEETDGEKSNEWEVDSIFDQAMLKPFIREVTVSGLVTGIHGMHSIVWTLESGLIVKVYERGIVGKWLKLKLDSPQAEEASSFELCDGPPLMNVRFVPSKITEKEKGIVVVTCVCTVIDPSNQPFNSQLGGTSIMYSEQFGRIQTDGKQLPEGIKAGDTVLTEIVPLDQGIGGFELAKCHRIFGSEETSIKVEDSYIPEHIRTLEEWATQLQAIELYSYQKGKDVHSENVIGKSCREKDLNLSIDPMGMKKDLVDEKEITVTAEMEGNEKSQLSTSGVISSVSTQQYFTGNEVDPEGDTVTEDNEGGEGTVQGKEDTVAVDAYTKTLDNSLDSSDVPVKKEVEKDNEKEEKERVSDISIDVIFISREDMWICEKAAAEYDWMKKKKIEESEEEEGEKGDGEGSLMWREEQTVRVERQIVMEKEAEETKEEKGRESEEEEETQNTRVEEDRESEVVERTREEEEGDSEEEEETKEEEERESEERDAESLEETEITGHTVDEKENKENLATRVEEASEKVSAATSLPTVDGHKKDEELATGVLYDEPKSSSYPQPSSTPIATVSADDQPQPSTDQTTNSTRSHIEKQKSSSYNSMATTVMLELLKEEADTTLAKKAVYCFVLRRFEGLVSLISPAEDGKIILKERECEVKGSFDFSSIQCGDWLKVVAYPRKKRTKKDEEIRGFRHVATKVLQHCHWKDVHSSKFLPSVMPQKVIGPFIQFQLTFDLRRQDVLSHGGSDIFYLRDWEYEDIGVTVKKNRLKQHVNTVTLTAPFLIRAWCHCVAAVDGFWLNIRPMTKIEKLNEEDGTWSLVTSEGTDIAMTSGTDNEE